MTSNESSTQALFLLLHTSHLSPSPQWLEEFKWSAICTCSYYNFHEGIISKKTNLKCTIDRSDKMRVPSCARVQGLSHALVIISPTLFARLAPVLLSISFCNKTDSTYTLRTTCHDGCYLQTKATGVGKVIT